MKLSTSFWQTHKEIPADAEIISHQLMIRAGLITKMASGLYYLLPFALKIQRKIEQVIREEFEKIDLLEMSLPIMTSSDLWKETGRWEEFGPQMLRAIDRGKRELCFSPTNEEAVTDVFRKMARSYKQMPVCLYQINEKFRDEIRPRFGLMRAREFVMMDAYTFHMNTDCLETTYQKIYQAYEHIFQRLGLCYLPVVADGGAMASSGSKTHEFQVLASSGEDSIVFCKKCGFAANQETAVTKRSCTVVSSPSETRLIHTPDKKTIKDVCAFLGLPENQSIKTLVYQLQYADCEKTAFLFLLGDDDVNEVKLKNHTKCTTFRPLQQHELESLGLHKGFIGVKKIPPQAVTIIDKQVGLEASYVIGADQEDYHYTNFSFKNHDTNSFHQYDIRLTKADDHCDHCDSQIEITRGIEVGHVFQLGDKYTRSMNVTMLDQQGKKATPLMGCYGIGVTRIIAAAIEQNHDKNGIIWPSSLAPFQLYLCALTKDPSFRLFVDELYKELRGEGFDVFYDDRDATPGVMFNDADLLGIPLRVLVGEKVYSQEGMIEVKNRKTGEVKKITKENLLGELRTMLNHYGK
jgi:prolyl-tRNA synthetase